MSSRRCAVYAVFLQNCVQLFDKFNTMLQTEEPLIYKLQRILLSLYKDILQRFIKPGCLAKEENILRVDYKNKDEQFPNESLVVGYEVKPFLEKLKQIGKDEFYGHVREYYMTALDYMKQKLPLSDVTLKHAEVADIEKRSDQSFDSVVYFADL